MHVTQWPLVLQSCVYIPTVPSLNVVITPRRQPVPLCRHPLVCPAPMPLNAMQSVLHPCDAGASLGHHSFVTGSFSLGRLEVHPVGARALFLSLCLSAFVLASSVHHSCYCCLLSALGSRDHRTESREIHLLFFFFHTKTEIVDFTQHTSVPSHFLSSPFHLCVQTLIPATVRFTQARSLCRS